MANCLQVDGGSEAIPMACWEAEAIHDLGKVYARKYSDFRDDQATVWTSMYEKNLGRKVSRLPPWEVSQTGRKESSERHFGDPDKRDFASIHLERAAQSGVLGQKKHVPREKKKEKKSRNGSDSRKDENVEQKSKNGNARTSSVGEQVEDAMKAQ